MAFGENDIRPTALFQQYLELCSKDAQAFFLDAPKHHVPCPACGCEERKSEFVKWGFGFVSCRECESLFQSPRPGREVFFEYYLDSPSVRFWTEVFSPQVLESRREHLFAPKAKQVLDLCESENFAPATLVDVGAGFGMFLEEWRRFCPEVRAVALEPNGDMAEVCRTKGFEVIEKFTEEADEFRYEADVAISLEVLEHVYEPIDFCRSVRSLLKSNGRALFTTLSSSGFDIQILWDKARCVAPPQHLNFMTTKGLKILMDRAGFSQAKVFTPGKLDVDILRNAYERGELPEDARFVRSLLESGEETSQAFQEFLSQNALSSHCWVWAVND